MQPITLRFPEPADAPLVFEAVRESMTELHRWMSWCHPNFALEDALQWITAQPKERENGSAFEFLIVGAQNRVLGCCGLNSIHRGYRMANLGYWVRTSETGRGVATRAVTYVSDWAFAHTDLERLEIVAAVGNTASQAVAVKAGATREGILRSRLCIHDHFHDAVMHSLIRPK